MQHFYGAEEVKPSIAELCHQWRILIAEQELECIRARDDDHKRDEISVDYNERTIEIEDEIGERANQGPLTCDISLEDVCALIHMVREMIDADLGNKDTWRSLLFTCYRGAAHLRDKELGRLPQVVEAAR